MKIEFLFHRSCPNWQNALRELTAALKELGIDEEPKLVEVRDENAAKSLRFPGSPTIRCDEEDLFPTEAPKFGLFRRLYLSPAGLQDYPDRSMIVEALEKRILKGKEVKKMAEKVVDPVCGMEVDPATAPAKAEYKGKTYYFCAPVCKEEFEKNPERYLPAEGRRGCCC